MVTSLNGGPVVQTVVPFDYNLKDAHDCGLQTLILDLEEEFITAMSQTSS